MIEHLLESIIIHGWLLFWTILIGGLLIRLTICLPSYNRPAKSNKSKSGNVSIMIIWGSGGHTTEMILLLKKLKVEKFQPIYNVLANTDETSTRKIQASESPILECSSWHRIIRSREVKQSWITTIWTTFLSCWQSIYIVITLQPKLILCNGPGTCVPLCYAAFLCKFFGFFSPTIVFVESFCRVEKLSLTGKLLYPVVDKFLVQWPDLLKSYARAEYLGDL